MIDKIRAHVLALPRRTKQIALITFDFTALLWAIWVSFCLRYDRWYVPQSLDQWTLLLSAPVLAIPVFVRMGLYRAVVRYLPERAMWTMLRAMFFATIAWILLIFLASMAGRGIAPRSVPIIYFGIGALLIIGSRFASKWVFLSGQPKKVVQRKSTIIYGISEAGIQLVQALRNTHNVVGFIDDTTEMRGREISGIRIYPSSMLEELVKKYHASDLVLSIQSIDAERRREIVTSAGALRLKIRSLPAVADLMTGKYRASQVKEIDVVELLGRSSVPPDPNLIRTMIVGRSIMITGAGGSIGSELCRKIASWNPKRVVLFEANEFALYQIEQDLQDFPGVVVIPVLGSILDSPLVEKTIAAHGVNVLFHAAAHKHVPLVEANALEGIKNNVFGTAVVADAAYSGGVEHFVLISTDKAVRPTNVMGASKRWAELIVSQKAKDAKLTGSEQRFCSVRFGNVLGSNGSVVPRFKKQIEQGGPVTLTDAGMKRYFMSIQEAAELIVQAGALSKGDDVFLLDMGKPMAISDLAENMIRLAGLTVRSDSAPLGDIEIKVVGKRPGEKLHEELFYDAANAQATEHPKIMRAAHRTGDSSLGAALGNLEDAVKRQDEHEARNILFELVGRGS